MDIKNKERKKIGSVSVDSGQLMVIDPCYMERWIKDSDAKIIGVKFWGTGQDIVAEKLKELGYSVDNTEIPGKVSLSDKEVNDKNLIEELINKIYKMVENREERIVCSVQKTSSYENVCKATSNEEQSGYILGDLGIAFNSGLGDGVYDVYATFADIGNWGRRITKVEIDLIGE